MVRRYRAMKKKKGYLHREHRSKKGRQKYPRQNLIFKRYKIKKREYGERSQSEVGSQRNKH